LNVELSTKCQERIKYALSAYIEDLVNHQRALNIALEDHHTGFRLLDAETHRAQIDGLCACSKEIREYQRLLVDWTMQMYPPAAAA
jgi:hypothetical protein